MSFEADIPLLRKTSDSIGLPDVQKIRADAIRAGAQDPMTLRFRIVRCERSSGEVVGLSRDDLSFSEAVEATIALIEDGDGFEYLLEPIGFVN